MLCWIDGLPNVGSLFTLTIEFSMLPLSPSNHPWLRIRNDTSWQKKTGLGQSYLYHSNQTLFLSLSHLKKYSSTHGLWLGSLWETVMLIAHTGRGAAIERQMCDKRSSRRSELPINVSSANPRLLTTILYYIPVRCPPTSTTVSPLFGMGVITILISKCCWKIEWLNTWKKTPHGIWYMIRAP